MKMRACTAAVWARGRRRGRSTIAEARSSSLGCRTRDLRVQALRSSDLGSKALRCLEPRSRIPDPRMEDRAPLMAA
eukprot:1172078-Pyramimonas_sp.AAC.1